MGGVIASWADKFGGRSLRAQAIKNPSFAGDRTPPADGVSLEQPAVARVNASRWIADCPVTGCEGAEYVNLDERLFFCCECRNQAFGNSPIKVALPDADTLAEIERLLLLRPAPASRNWESDRSVDDLKAENTEAGDPT